MAHLRDGRVVVPPDGGFDSVSLSLLLEEGDLLFNRTNSQELVGKVGLFVGHESPVTFASYLVRLHPRPNHEPEFLNMALNDTSFLSRARREAIPSLHQSNLNPTRYGRLHIALPSKEEQQSILLALRQEIAENRRRHHPRPPPGRAPPRVPHAPHRRRRHRQARRPRDDRQPAGRSPSVRPLELDNNNDKCNKMQQNVTL